MKEPVFPFPHVKETRIFLHVHGDMLRKRVFFDMSRGVPAPIGAGFFPGWFCRFIQNKNALDYNRQITDINPKKEHPMNSCKEFALDDLMAVTAIPVEDYRLGTLSWQLTPTIPSSAFSPTLSRAITIGQSPAVAGGRLIPIVKTTGKAKDAEGDSVAGRLHTVTVTCEADDREASVWNHLLALERTPSHLLLTFRDGTRGFVSATRDTYTCEVERNGAKTNVRLRSAIRSVTIS